MHPDAPDPWTPEAPLDTNCDGFDGVDADGDGYPANEELVDDPVYDCNDNHPGINPGADEIPNDGLDNDCSGDESVDADGDGHVAGYDDCDDADPAVFLGAVELPDRIDNDCDELIDEGTEAADDDGDGFCEGWDLDGDGVDRCSDDSIPGDCNDANALLQPADLDADGWSTCDADCDDENDARTPGSPEVCDGQDNDCDSLLPVDEQDLDEDGYPTCIGDCDDSLGTVFPGAQEFCDLLDNDCDGVIDETYDADGDGVSTCGADGIPGTADDDCDDSDASTAPGLVEACDLADTDCDPSTVFGTPGDGVDADGDGDPACNDCDDTDPALENLDLDGDLFTSCTTLTDCDDTNSNIWPGASDAYGDTVDSNCDGVDGVDADGDGDPWGLDCDDSDPALNLSDLDGDGASSCGADGQSGTTDDDCDDSNAAANPNDADGDGVSTCGPDGLPASGDEDCDDSNALVYPGGIEFCDLFDNDCDATTGEPGDGVDGDGDGAAACADCDDANGANYPGGIEVCDGQDNDCQSWTDESGDADGDGVSAICGLDCDDYNGDSWPGAPELCDLEDNNCDGVVDEGFGPDLDGDGYFACQGDCDDSDALLHPGQWDTPGDGVDTDCDQTDVTGLGVSADLTMVGEGPGDTAGWLVASAGDVDGDSFADLLVTAPGARCATCPLGAAGAAQGRAYVVAGGSYLDPRISLQQAGVAVQVSESESLATNSLAWLGTGASTVGDLDGDGQSEVAVGAPNLNNSTGVTGAVYIFTGAQLSVGGPVNTSTAAISIYGDLDFTAGGFGVGGRVSGAADLDGDGTSDLLVGGAEFPDVTTFVFSLGGLVGPGFGAVSATLDTAQADVAFSLATASSISIDGDIDGDGLSDIVLGTPWPASNVHVFFASSVLAGGAFGLSQADVILQGSSSDYTGFSIDVGDLDADGLADVVIGAPWNGEAGTQAGKTHLVLGAEISAGGTFDLSTTGMSFVGESAGDESGTSVAFVGDVDADGTPDVMIGAPGNSENGASAGKAYLFLGSTVLSGPGTWTLDQSDAAFVGVSPAGQAGWSVAGAGDVDGDGRSDLLVGIPGDTEGGGTAVFSGGSPGQAAGKACLLLSPF